MVDDSEQPKNISADPRLNNIAQALADARASNVRAVNLEDTYIRYVILANAGGIAACLGIADAIVGKQGRVLIPAISEIICPLWLFFFGLIAGGVMVSLRAAQATHQTEQNAERAKTLLASFGQNIPPHEGIFSKIEEKAIPYLNYAINAFGIISQFCFFIGGFWGILRIVTALNISA